MINTTRQGSPEPAPLRVVLAAAARGAAVGEMIRRHLTTLCRRRGSETGPQGTGSPAFGCPSLGRSNCAVDRRAGTRAVALTVVVGLLALPRPWLPVVELDVQRLADKIISRCYVPADHRDNHAVFTCDPALLERAAGGGLIAFVGC